MLHVFLVTMHQSDGCNDVATPRLQWCKANPSKLNRGSISTTNEALMLSSMCEIDLWHTWIIDKSNVTI